MPAVAVVMPVYNRADRVRRAVESVLGQDFPDFELIVVDDGSEDGATETVESVGDARVRCLRQPENRGANAARNRGIRAASSPLVCFLDSDDEFLPRKLGFVVDWFARRPEMDALVDSFRLVHPPETGRPAVERRNPRLSDSREIERAVFARRLYKATPALSVRRATLLEVGLFDESLKRRQDMDLILRLARSARCASVPEVLWVKRWSPDAISAKQDTFVAAVLDTCERRPDYLTRPEFRIGLARDLARHFLRLARAGRARAARDDLRRCAAAFGGGRLARLVAEGMVEILRRKRRRRRG